MAYEPRFAAGAVWGGNHNWAEVQQRRLQRPALGERRLAHMAEAGIDPDARSMASQVRRNSSSSASCWLRTRWMPSLMVASRSARWLSSAASVATTAGVLASASAKNHDHGAGGVNCPADDSTGTHVKRAGPDRDHATRVPRSLACR